MALIPSLIPFKGSTVISNDPFKDPFSTPLANFIPDSTPSIFIQSHKDIIDVILDGQTISPIILGSLVRTTRVWLHVDY